MSRTVYISTIDVLPSLRGLSYSPRVKWIRLRERMKERGLMLLAVPEEQMKGFGWKLYIDQKNYRSPFSVRQSEEYSEDKKAQNEHPANIDLELIFQTDKMIDPSKWSMLTEHFYAFVLCISTEDIARKTNQFIQDNVIYQHRVLTNFPFIDLFKSCKNRSTIKYLLHDQLTETLWDIVLAWLHTLRSMKRHLPARLSIRERIFNFPDPISFQKLLPSSQFALILLQYMSIEILDFGSRRLLDRYIENCHDFVSTIVKGKGNLISQFIDKQNNKSHNYLETGQLSYAQELKASFLQLVEEDLRILLFQEILVDESTLNIKSSFLDTPFEPFLIKKSDWQVWMESISAHRFRDRISYGSTQDKSRIWPYVPILVDPCCRLPSQPRETTSMFRRAADQLLQNETAVSEFIKKKWQEQFFGLSNFLSYPYFSFTFREEQLVPQWNLIDQEIGENLLDERALFEQRLGEKHRQMQKQLKGKSRKKKIPRQLQADGVVRNIIKQHNQAIDIQLAVRRQKMSEFGIFNDNRTDEDHSEVWLNEMLKIEQEIAPYLMFVKNAFQSALPIRKLVEVNHDRHSTDGVDFDPESMQNIQKWMHGEIMTTLKTTNKRLNAAQINSFALDASGSMDHRRMRNLFKILVLMVMGLEDRKSFDSFHFFNYNFIEGARFSGSYTNRNLLFRILKRIASIEEGRVFYSGNGGTNMGDGIMECHDRIQTFHKYIQNQHPDMVFLKSLFVISDGQPSVGVTDPMMLNTEIVKRRGKNDVAIKGIYLKPLMQKSNESFMMEIFGEGNYVESSNFAAAVNELVHIMAGTYKIQRQNLKYQKIS